MEPLALLPAARTGTEKAVWGCNDWHIRIIRRGEERPDSDVDVLVSYQNGKKTFDNFMGTKFYLEDLFKRKVDLVTDNALKPLIRDPILRDVIYA